MGGKQYIESYFASELYRELDIRYNPEQQALWCYLLPTSRPCCTSELLAEVRRLLHAIQRYPNYQKENDKQKILRYLVIASRTPGVFNLGGDLNLFLNHIRSGNRDGLYYYARVSIDIAYASYHLPITTIALVQGDAYGGGFEGALVSRVLIAERQARMGLPDVLFNLLPLCAYNLLARRLDPARAERLVLSGRTYSAEELHEIGVVDVLAENGEGEKAVSAYIKKQDRANNSYQAVHKIRQIIHPLNYNELLEAAKVWLDAAMLLSERDLRVMERIAQSQEKLVVSRPPAEIKQLA
jgi:DSF synthase